MGSLETPPSWVDPIVCLASIERPFDAAWPLQPGSSLMAAQSLRNRSGQGATWAGGIQAHRAVALELIMGTMVGGGRLGPTLDRSGFNV